MVKETERKRIICSYLNRLLYDMHSPRASNGRGIVFGRIYAADGTLVATTSQEGIMRLTEKEQENRMKSKL